MDASGSRATPQLITNPYIGIAGVFLGAGLATLNARLLSIGLADLRGALGLGFDEASWIPTTLNMAMMFSGVFVVFLNVLYGTRRILLPAAAIFALTSALLPFAHVAIPSGHAAGLLTKPDSVDLYRLLNLGIGDRVSLSVSAQTTGSSLQSILRLFDATGQPIALDDQESGDPRGVL